ncbi:hypothetical protein [Nocardia blacklockiae]|uniref:hypothetical protein n=1 Tax=Nocardia blacklockiae TaxID=480036 RepID=UPI0018953D0E|nr:hypothetical protein [Nocardia blacklockiae]MBF6172137.1 hypothetical protein [Nocardia blacklockiae]
MNSKTSTRRVAGRAGTVAAGAVAAAAFALLAAQPADASVTRLGATADLSVGRATNYGTGCRYTVQAFVDDAAAPVTFFDNGVPIGRVRPAGAYALTGWIPATQGPHTLTAVQDGQPAELPPAPLTLSVGQGVPLGFGCGVFGG